MTYRIRLSVIALAAAAIGACATESTAPLSAGSDAALAADQFTKLADSVNRNGGDADVGGAYAAIASAVRAGGRVSPIVLTIDGVSAPFVATAMSNELSYGAPCSSNGCAALPRPMLTRTLIAWDAANPKRVVQLSAQSDDELIDALLYPSLLALYVPHATLVYMDGKGGTYFGTSGTQKMAETKSATPCAASRDSAVISKLPSTCTQSDFTITFSSKVEPSAFLVANNTATGVHTLSMSAQTVAGSHVLMTVTLCDTACNPGGPNSPPVTEGPPVVVRPSSQLPATLTTTVDSLVTMTLTVKNPSADPIKVTFPSGQKYDFVVTDSTTGRDVWRWADGKGFTMALVDQTVPGNGSLVFTERWKPVGRGRYLVHGLLVSLSHRAEAYASVLVP